MAVKTPFRTYYKHEAIMRYARILGFGEVHTKIDVDTGLHAVIAIHNTKLGPAIGGTRCFRYSSAGPAMIDALRLAYTMTLKAAVSDLPHGGAKAVLMRPRVIHDREAYFRAYGDFVHEMNGRYITAVDIGTTEADMNIIAQRTPYVFGASSLHTQESDPSPQTAIGVMRGIEAAAKFKWDRDNLDGLHVAVQGAGAVGYYLCRFLHERGVKLTVCDPKPAATEQCQKEFNADVVALDDIYSVDCDIYAPCAVGGTINLDTLNQMKASIIAGSANAQLAHTKYAEIAKEKGILYAPDFVINAGGLIHAAIVYDYQDHELANQKIDKLYNTLLQIFERSASEGHTTLAVAQAMAHERLDIGSVSDPYMQEAIG